MDDTPATFITQSLADPAIAWSIGSFGAIAEFMWSPDEAGDSETSPLSRVTPRGGLQASIASAPRAVRYTTPSREPARRHSGIAFCLPQAEAAMARRTTITELRADADALRDEDRDAILFDMGLGQWQVDVMVRSRDRETLAVLRAAEGRSLFDPALTLMRDLPRLSPHRVFTTRCGRVEVYQTIPAADGRSPDGPHTHVLPKLLKAGCTHAATIDIPAGLVPCLTLHFARPDPTHALNMALNRQDAPHGP